MMRIEYVLERKSKQWSLFFIHTKKIEESTFDNIFSFITPIFVQSREIQTVIDC